MQTSAGKPSCPPSLSQHEALVYVMVMMSAVDREMSDDEFTRIGRLVQFLPAFEGFDEDHLVLVGHECAAQLAAPEGLDIVLEIVREALPERLHETAYALAVEIAAADQRIRNEEIRLLQLLRDRLGLDKLTCAAIERGALARFRK